MGQGSSRPEQRRPSRLHRAQTAITDSIPSIFSRRSSQNATPSPRRTRPSSIAAFSSLARARTRRRSNARDDTHRYTLPNVNVPALDLDFHDVEAPATVQPRAVDTSSRRPERRASSFLTDRMSALRPHRRRRSPHRREEDQAAMLSEILAAAAAATAASLMGEDPRGTSDTRNFGGDDEDGTFDSFLQALQNGRIASALRGENVNDTDTGGMPAPLNFFRMFRFGSNNPNRRIERQEETDNAGETDGDGRMVPIIIVGIRSINPSNGGSQDENIPPFLEALSAFPSPLVTQGQGERETAVDGILRQSAAPTARFSHRRRASMGGFPANYDSQRHHPRPPPSTPSSAPLSAISSGATTPTMNPATAATSATPSRRESLARRPPAFGLESTSEEPTTQRTPRQRRLSESDFATRFGSGSSRRNGVVEPDHDPGEGSRSWIIYVLGGSYSENHPIFTTPSLFTDSPTYEDMLLLSALLGPAKPPVASEADVAAASGLYRIILTEEQGLVAEAITLPDEATAEPAKEETSVAAPSDEPEIAAESKTIVIAPDQRCLVCLGEYEAGEEARQLIKCEHLFHKECIDHWLLNGRNSCPLCRRQGVGEEEQSDQSEAETDMAQDEPHLSTSEPERTLSQPAVVS